MTHDETGTLVVMGLMASGLLLMVGFVVFTGFVFGGIMELVRARVGRERDASYLDAGLLLAGAALLAAVPWVAARLAERATGWVDTDRDGMLDPMVNGAYDWSDINAGHWFMYAALLAAVIVGGVVAIVMVHRSRARRRPPPPGHNLVTDFPQQAVTGEVSTT